MKMTSVVPGCQPKLGVVSNVDWSDDNSVDESAGNEGRIGLAAEVIKSDCGTTESVM